MVYRGHKAAAVRLFDSLIVTAQRQESSLLRGISHSISEYSVRNRLIGFERSGCIIDDLQCGRSRIGLTYVLAKSQSCMLGEK
jgi:hypothetical protein